MTPTANPNLWIQCQQPRPAARVRLFCLPYAGGGAAAYRGWSNHLPGDIEVCAIQLPGRDNRMLEKPYSDMQALVLALTEGLGPRLNAPYALFGHSMGALIAYELVRHLRRIGGTPPVHLFVSARRAPHVPAREPECHQLPEQEFVQTLVRRYNGIPQAILAEPELMKLFIPILRTDFTLMETYRHTGEEPLDQPITVLGGVEDQIVDRGDLAAWQDVTRRTMDLHMMPGGHFFIQTAQTSVLPIVAQRL